MQGNTVMPQRFYDQLPKMIISFASSRLYCRVGRPMTKYGLRLSDWGFSCSYAVKSLDYVPRGVKVHATAAETNQPKWWEKNVGPNMIDVHSTQEFLDALSQAEDRLVIVEFFGTWCASCRALFPKVCRIVEQHPEIIFLKVNFDENKSLCKSLNIKVLPYFHFYRGAECLVDSFSCSLVKIQKLKDAITTHNKALLSDSLLGNNGYLGEDCTAVPVAPEDSI